MSFKNRLQPRVVLSALLILLLTSACAAKQPVVSPPTALPDASAAAFTIQASPALTDPPPDTPLPTATLTSAPTATAPPASLPATPTSASTEVISRQGETCQQARGEVAELQTQDDASYGSGSARVYLPPCYSASPTRRYPTLYLLHGMNNTDEQWVRLGVPSAADELIRSGQVAPFIIVMPNEPLTDQDPDDSQFDDWLVNVLVPSIDQHYATCTTRACRAIGGLSRGSGWAFRIGLMSWQTFGSIGAHSFSPFDGDLQNMDTWLGAMSASQRPRLYLDIGIYDQAVPTAQQFEQKLTNLRFEHEWHLNDGAHNEDYWRAHVVEYLMWYAADWR